VLRTHAARALEYAAPSSATDALLTALQNERALATRKAVIYALARYHAAPVTAALIPFLKHKEAELRATAAYALAELADTAAASALHECLTKRRGDKDAFVRAEAARALGRIGCRASSADLRKALLKDVAVVRRAAAEALGWLVTPQETETIAALQTAAQADDPYLRAAATLALQRIRQRAAA
jgi:HEAT repeat protein